MSRGPGRIERAALAFMDEGAAFTVDDICNAAYPGIVPQKRHRVAASRAARLVLPEGWHAYRERWGRTWNHEPAHPSVELTGRFAFCYRGPVVFARSHEDAWARLSVSQAKVAAGKHLARFAPLMGEAGL